MFYSGLGTVFLVLSTSTRTVVSHKQKLNRHFDGILLARTPGKGSGVSASLLCAPGTYGVSGAEPCTSCAPGTYQPDQGKTSCIAASPGYYAAGTAQTSQSACVSGTYSSVKGSAKCLACPAGYQCPTPKTTTPEICPPGRYAASGASDCEKCPEGNFQGLAGQSDCCICNPGWYSATGASAACRKCSDRTPYSNPGSRTPADCSATPGIWKPTSTSVQGPNGECPGYGTLNAGISYAFASGVPSRRGLKHMPRCKPNEEACPVYSGLLPPRYVCMDVKSNLESCGGCMLYGADGKASDEGGRDCSAIPGVNEVSCRGGNCDIGSCQPGYTISFDRTSCVIAL